MLDQRRSPTALDPVAASPHFQAKSVEEFVRRQRDSGAALCAIACFLHAVRMRELLIIFIEASSKPFG